MMLGSGDRLRCAVHRHPELALRLLLPLVGGSDRFAGLAAAKVLGELGPAASAAVPRLVIMLKSRGETSRAMAAQSLAKMGPAAEPAVDALIDSLNDEAALVRRGAARALAHVGPGAARAARPIAELLRDPHPQVRNTASFALQELGFAGGGAVPVLVDLLDEEDPELRLHAVRALGNIGPFAEAAQSRLEALRDDPAQGNRVYQAASVALGKIDLANAVHTHREQGGLLLPLLLARLQSDDPEQRREAAGLIALIGPAARPAVGDLLRSGEDPDPSVRSAALRTLGAIGTNEERVIAALLAGLEDPQTRGDALHALGNLGASTEPVVLAVAPHVDDLDPSVRRMALQVLVGFGPEAAPATDALLARLSDEDSTVRRQAANALVNIDPSGHRLRVELLRLLAAEDPVVHRSAADELARQAERVPAIVDDLVPHLTDERESVRFAAARALGKIGAAAAAASAIPVLRRLLDDTDPGIRAMSADTLGRIGADSLEAHDALAARLDVDDLSTQREALHGLSKLGPVARRELPKLIALLRDPDLQTHQAAGLALESALSGDPEPVLPDLLLMLADSDPNARTGAAFALSRFGARAAPAVEPLIAQLDDPFALPRTYAAVALGAIGPAAADALPRLKELQWERDYRISGAAREALKEIRRRPRPAKRR